jgi:hypothetical protein
MVTKEQAMTCRDFHYTGNRDCTCTVGPKGGKKYCITQVRASGKCQTWKTRPDEFRLPVKYGIYESSAITHSNAHNWHTAADCPLNKK